MSSAEDVVPELVSYWANHLKCDVDTIRKLDGGINSKVYCCSNQEGRWVIKSYATHQERQSNRMKAEVEFLEYANKVTPGYTPKIYHQDRFRNCVIMEMLDGEPFQPSEVVCEQETEKGLQFLRQLNRDRSLAAKYIHCQAAEGYLSIFEQIENIRSRLERLSARFVCTESQLHAMGLISYTEQALKKAEDCFEEYRLNGLVEDRISKSQLYVSPSDFGFHNAIRGRSAVYFIDFEFAGWDDPAKTIIDFILQPKCPVDISLDRLLAIYPEFHVEALLRRCKVMFPILRAKWLCIILSVLDPSRFNNIGGKVAEESFVLGRLRTAEEFIYRSSACVDHRLKEMLR